jgi:hypothetical protein
MCPLMADTANDVRVVAAAETGIARRRGRARAPRLDAGRRPRRHRGNADRPDHRQGADGHQIDLSAQFIELVEKLGIAYGAVRLDAARRVRKTSKAVS